MSNYKHLIQENAWLKQQLVVLQETNFKREARLAERDKKQREKMLSRENMSTTPQTELVKQWSAQAATDKARFIKDKKNLLKRMPGIRKHVRGIINQGAAEDLTGLGMDAADQAEVFTDLAKQGTPIIPPPNREEQRANLSRMNRENNPKPVKKS